jgi:hypothetical protein
VIHLDSSGEQIWNKRWIYNSPRSLHPQGNNCRNAWQHQKGASSMTHAYIVGQISITTARAWHNSEAYQALVPLRESAADVLLSGFEESL